MVIASAAALVVEPTGFRREFRDHLLDAGLQEPARRRDLGDQAGVERSRSAELLAEHQQRVGPRTADGRGDQHARHRRAHEPDVDEREESTRGSSRGQVGAQGPSTPDAHRGAVDRGDYRHRIARPERGPSREMMVAAPLGDGARTAAGVGRDVGDRRRSKAPPAPVRTTVRRSIPPAHPAESSGSCR